MRSALLVTLLLTAGCSNPQAERAKPSPGRAFGKGVLTISAIPDQDPQKLQRLYSSVAGYLAKELGVEVKYVPVTDYTASVSLFRVGDFDMVWFGGLTGVQARSQVKGAQAILQRDIDEAFRSVFIASSASGIKPVSNVKGLWQLRGRRFTFGSESSTSGRLMPQYFLDKAGLGADDFAGPPGYSGSHDKTVELVQAATYEAGALNEQVWKTRTAAGQVDAAKTTAIFTTPAYHDYHWVVRPDFEENFGAGFTDKVKRAFKELDPTDPEQSQILDLFGAKKFIDTKSSNYGQIEEISRKLNLLQ